MGGASVLLFLPYFLFFSLFARFHSSPPGANKCIARYACALYVWRKSSLRARRTPEPGQGSEEGGEVRFPICVFFFFFSARAQAKSEKENASKALIAAVERQDKSLRSRAELDERITYLDD